MYVRFGRRQTGPGRDGTIRGGVAVPLKTFSKAHGDGNTQVDIELFYWLRWSVLRTALDRGRGEFMGSVCRASKPGRSLLARGSNVTRSSRVRI
jgi:hypothetical protein